MALSVQSWQLTGSSYQNGRHIAGCTRLYLSNGEVLWFPESTSLADAVTQARDRGFDTTEIQQRIADWVATGNGAKFTLS